MCQKFDFLAKKHFFSLKMILAHNEDLISKIVFLWLFLATMGQKQPKFLTNFDTISIIFGRVF